MHLNLATRNDNLLILKVADSMFCDYLKSRGTLLYLFGKVCSDISNYIPGNSSQPFIGFEFTLSVFLPESGLDSINQVNLQIPLSSNHELGAG